MAKSGIESLLAELAGAKKPESIWDNYVPILVTKKRTTIYLTEAISSPGEYNEMCNVLLSAKKDDKITLVINNGGGLAHSAFMVVDAMKKSKATIHGVISGFVASAATIITMYCDTIEVAPYTTALVHNYSHGTEGSGAQVKDYVNFSDNEFTKAVKVIYEGFITEQEMEDISLRDKELWLNAEEIQERWNNKIKVTRS